MVLHHFSRRFQRTYRFLLKIYKSTSNLDKICVKSYKIPLGLRKHVQISSFWVLTGAKDAETYFTDEFRDENK